MKLLFVPIVVVLWGLAVSGHIFPIHVNFHGFYGQDPAYQYLFSALDLLSGNSPIHTDHPGTPMQTGGAIVIFVFWLLQLLMGLAAPNLFDAVLTNPELYLRAVSVTLIFFNGFTTAFLGATVYQKKKYLVSNCLSVTSSTIFCRVCNDSLPRAGVDALWVVDALLWFFD